MTDGVCQDPTYKKEQKIQQNSQCIIQYKEQAQSDLINHRNGNHVSLVVAKAFIPTAIVEQGWAGRRPTAPPRGVHPPATTCYQRSTIVVHGQQQRAVTRIPM